MISIKMNGESKEIRDSSVVADVIELYGIKGPFAITVNRVLVTRGNYGEHKLYDGDVLDVIYPIQGG